MTETKCLKIEVFANPIAVKAVHTEIGNGKLELQQEQLSPYNADADSSKRFHDDTSSTYDPRSCLSSHSLCQIQYAVTEPCHSQSSQQAVPILVPRIM